MGSPGRNGDRMTRHAVITERNEGIRVSCLVDRVEISHFEGSFMRGVRPGIAGRTITNQ